MAFEAILDSQGSKRIRLGGQPATLGQFPYQVSIRTSGNHHRCSGAIVSNRWILTSGHCTSGHVAGSLFVIAGTVMLNSGGTIFTTSNVVTHPQYTRQLNRNE